MFIVIKCDTRRRTKRLPSLRFSTPIRYDTIHKCSPGVAVAWLASAAAAGMVLQLVQLMLLL